MEGFLALLDTTLNRLYALCGALAAGAVVLIALLVATNVVTRLMGLYVGGLTEGAGYAMAAAGSLGLAWTFGTGGHIRVDLVLEKLPDDGRRRLDQFALVATAASICFAAWYLARMTWISWDYGDLSDGSDALPLWLPQLPAAFGFCVFALALVHGSIKYLWSGRSPVVEEREKLLSSSDGKKADGA
jgi:TRAP-type C4-dicarboxylate transport system permease small subunit